ncbi:ergothioneine biosynthesis protein EgtC [Klenkia taihuensis]|uniref:Gamma-glutamyl-hercynylcysteine sulfoxide hydrolase n=1 Tax=Klenkia taihuensis TaxID=1225127 RepID=A0A1I1P572_9ACTN|nr:ergothioneine biosynthesis protein EgtC [Klenkia taihuensis]GHE11424.1 gamma-glutamyl-hercynylcysteine sulfoxide hydrolase [Klenkia taihuensis]SFD05081.1 glutamine amidotransferase [Klenkia taihuensis]
MCRHIAWLGRPRTLASLVLEPPSSLLVQSYAPRRQRHGTVNADGWGVGWWAPDRPEPARWRAATPLWGSASFASVAPAVASTCVLAAVRSATVGMPVDETAAAPFTDGRWLLSHNGRVDRAVLPPAPGAESVCDSAQLAAVVLSRGAETLGDVVVEVGTADPAARLNLLATDGTRLLATTWGDTLSVLTTDEGTVVASEPFDDDPRWTDVPDRHLVTVTPDGTALEALQ